MSRINVPQPPIMRGDDPSQIASQVYAYLYQIAEQLNVSLEQMSEASYVETMKKSAIQTGNAPATERELMDQYSRLRSLIISTADEVEREMDVMRTEMTDTYVAQSDFGTYAAGIFTEYEQTAGYFEMQSQMISALNEYVARMNGYIKAGLLSGDAQDGIWGIEIGAVDPDSDDRPNFVRITPDRIGFYQGDTEACYISNGRWGSPGIDAKGTIRYINPTDTDEDRVWESGVDSAGRFYLRYVGE